MPVITPIGRENPKYSENRKEDIMASTYLTEGRKNIVEELEKMILYKSTTSEMVISTMKIAKALLSCNEHGLSKAITDMIDSVCLERNLCNGCLQKPVTKENEVLCDECLEKKTSSKK